MVRKKSWKKAGEIFIGQVIMVRRSVHSYDLELLKVYNSQSNKKINSELKTS